MRTQFLNFCTHRTPLFLFLQWGRATFTSRVHKAPNVLFRRSLCTRSTRAFQFAGCVKGKGRCRSLAQMTMRDSDPSSATTFGGSSGQKKILPFWKTKKLVEMTDEEWESLCDGCGWCCVFKFEDPDDSAVLIQSTVACELLHLDTCRCSNYSQRLKFVPTCIQLSARNVALTNQLPKTCAYRLVAEGKDLMEWHPLVSGDPQSVHRAGVSAQGKVISEKGLSDEDIEEHYLVDWIV